jgi:LysM repeat protein
VKGDSLNALAKRYGVSAADLRTWNKMDSDVVKIGQVIKIQAPAPDAAPAAPGGEEKPPEEMSAETPPVETPQGEAAPEIVPVETPAPETTPAPAPAEVPATAPPAETAPVEPPSEAAPAAPVTTPQPPDTDKREHTVAPGETLGAIAGMYGVTVAEIQSWNGLDPDETVINAGAALVVYLPVAVPGADAAPAPDSAKTPEPEKSEVEKPAPAEPAPGTYELYEVAAGDNLRRIAQRFGTTQQKLIEMNNLKSADLVQIGWKLKVPKQAEAPISGSTP